MKNMKNMKKLIFFFFFLFSTSLFSQTVDWKTLEEAELEEAKDYEKIEPEILKLIGWLGNHSLDHQKRSTANAHFVRWITGSAKVTVELNAYVLDYTKKNTDFMILFMAGWSQYVLENPDKKADKFEGNLAGVNYFLDFYKKGKDFGVKKDRKVAKLLKKRAAGNLEEFIAKKSN
jgi:hypothetical protein